MTNAAQAPIGRVGRYQTAVGRLGRFQNSRGRIGAFQGGPAILRGPVGTWDLEAETYAWLARLPGSPVLERRNVIAANRVVAGLKALGCWSSIKRFILPGDTAGQSVISLGSGTETIVGAPSHVPDTGFQHSASVSGYLNSGYQFDNTTYLDFSMFEWCIDGTAGAYTDIGATLSGNIIAIRPMDSGLLRVWAHSTAAITMPVTTPKGFSAVTRVGTTVKVQRGASIAASVQAASGLCSNVVCVGQLGTTGAKSPNLIGAHGTFSPALTDDQAKGVYALLLGYYQELSVLEADDQPPQPIYGPSVWTPSTIDLVTPAGLRIIQQDTIPLTAGDASYQYYPITLGQVGNVAGSKGATQSAIKALHMQFARRWQDRANPGRQSSTKPTFLVPSVRNTAGLLLAQEYSSPAKRDAADVIHAMWMVGHSDSAIVAYAQANGFPGAVAGFASGDVLSYGAATARKDDGTLWPQAAFNTNYAAVVCTDKVILPQWRANDFTTAAAFGGLLYDFERADGPRAGLAPNATDSTAAQTQAVVLAVANAVKTSPLAGIGKLFVLYSNNLLAASQLATFLNASTLAVIAASADVDAVPILLNPPGRDRVNPAIQDEIDGQLAIIGASVPRSKILVTVQTGPIGQTMPEADAAVIRTNLLAASAAGDGFWGVDIWPNGADQTGGSDNPHQRIQAAIFGLTFP